MKTTRFQPGLLGAMVPMCLLYACSVFNREGPTETCADLNNGQSNACKEGIIASCVAGKMTYEVCTDDNACDAIWQKAGQYRCGPTGSSGSGGAGTGGSGGAGTGGSGGAGTGGSGGGNTTLATTGGSKIDAYAVDATTAYFSDCHSLWSVPKAGGTATPLTSGLQGCSFGNIAVDGTHVYLLQDVSYNRNVVRVSTAGGTPEVVATGAGQIIAMAADDSNVYWAESYTFDFKKVSKSGGSPITIAHSNYLSDVRIVAQGGFLYWINQGSVLRVPTTVTSTTAPSTIPLGQAYANDFAADGTAVYFAGQSSVGRVDLSNGSTTVLADSLASPGHIAMDSLSVFWEASAGQIIQRVGKVGGTPTTVLHASTPNTYSLGRILVDETSIFWAEAAALMRGAK